MEKLPLIAVEGVSLYRPESGGVITPIVFYGGAKLRIAITTIRSLEILMLTVEHFWAVAVFKLHYSVMCLHHTLFCPVHSGGCFSEHIFALSILMSNAPEGSDIIETDFVLD